MGGQDIHVTSHAIRQLGKDLVEDVKPAFDPAIDMIRRARLSWPDFGLIGIPLNLGYDHAQDYATTCVTAAGHQLDAFKEGLDRVADTWDRAESTNEVQFR